MNLVPSLCLPLADSVEKVGKWIEQIALRWLSSNHLFGLVSCGLEVRYRYQFRQLPKVLGGCCEEELVAGAIRTS